MPLYFTKGYFRIGEDKWLLWAVSSGIFVAASAVLHFALPQKEKGFSAVDLFVLAHGVLCTVSSLLSPYGFFTFFGSREWNMGLLSQLLFVAVYFCISRTKNIGTSALYAGIAASDLVFFLEILMRFRIDPLGLYIGVEDKYRRKFVSTIGQATWFSSYLVLIIPVMAVLYINAKEKKWRILYGLSLCLASMSAVTQNSDCAYGALGIIFVILLWSSFSSNVALQRFLEIVMMTLASWKVIGILQIIFSKKIIQLDSLSLKLSQGRFTLILLVISVIIYVVFRLALKNNRIDIKKHLFLRKSVILVPFVMILVVVLYVVVNSMHLLPPVLSKGWGYLMFNNWWGSNRGFAWIGAFRAFKNEGWILKLLGSGPDTYGPHVYMFLDFSDPTVNHYFTHYLVACAHNEWLNMLITGGVIGGITYLGIYISAVKRYVLEGENDPLLIGYAVSIAAYIVHNFFCYQQVVCTSVIFVILGMAEQRMRQKS